MKAWNSFSANADSRKLSLLCQLYSKLHFSQFKHSEDVALVEILLNWAVYSNYIYKHIYIVDSPVYLVYIYMGYIGESAIYIYIHLYMGGVCACTHACVYVS